MKKIKITSFLLTMFALACILGACGVQTEPTDEPDIAPSAEPEEEIEVIPYGNGSFGLIGDYPGFYSMEDYCNGAANIVVGYYVDAEPEAWNMSRDPNDPTKESNYTHIEGLLYEFVVVETLKGNCVPGESITVNIEHGVRTVNRPKLYEGQKYYPPQFDELVILALDYDIYYYAAGYPFEMRFEEPILVEALDEDFTISDLGEEPLTVINPEAFYTGKAKKSYSVEGFGSGEETTVAGLLAILE